MIKVVIPFHSLDGSRGWDANDPIAVLKGNAVKSSTQRRLRDLHHQLSLFFAPGIVFFAVSGAFQTLGLHESGQDRQPAAAFIGVLANVHKKGVASPPKHKPSTTIAANKPSEPLHPNSKDSQLHLFEVYALLLSIALIVSATMGIAIAFANRSAVKRAWALLAAGCVVPILLLLI